MAAMTARHEQLTSDIDCSNAEIKRPKFTPTLREASIKGGEGLQAVAGCHYLAAIIRAAAQRDDIETRSENICLIIY
jgi:hypothetical protein